MPWGMAVVINDAELVRQVFTGRTDVAPRRTRQDQ